MKQLIITTIAAVVLVGCRPSVDIWTAAEQGDIKAVKQHLAAGTDVNGKTVFGETPLHQAAQFGHKEIAELLISEGADVNAKATFSQSGGGNPHLVGWTPLDWVIYNGEIEFAELLRKHGGKSGALDSIHIAAFLGNIEAVKQNLATVVDVNATNVGGDTPLNSAAGNGHKEIVELLIAEGADVNAKDNMFGTPLDVAIEENHTEIADLLRKHGGKTAEELRAEGNPTEPVAEAAKIEPPTAKAPDISIHKATGAWNLEAVKRHLAAGTDVNSKDEDGELTPLHWAVDLVAPNKMRTDLNRKERKELVELLIANDADVNALDKDSRTPLDLAQRNYSFNSTRQYPAPKSKAAILEIVELLVKNGAKHGTIKGAITGGDIKAVKEFLTNGADVNARDTVGQPLLVHAPTKEMAKMLIMNGANINAKAKHGKVENGPTVLSLAARDGRTEVVELLIAKGADVNAKSESGRTPLIWASLYNRKKIVELLITKGADINAKTNNGLTALDKATEPLPRNVLKEVNGLLRITSINYNETADLLRKHGAKTGEELKAEGK